MKRLWLIIPLLLFAVCALAVGTVTRVETVDSPVKKVVWYWISSDDGRATDTAPGLYSGKVLAVASIPSSASAPAATCDLYIYNTDRLDLLRGWGADLSASATSYIDCATQLGTIANDHLILEVSNAGILKAATVTIWIR